MALDMQQEIIRHQKGWEGFAKVVFVGTVGVILTLALMALFLL